MSDLYQDLCPPSMSVSVSLLTSHVVTERTGGAGGPMTERTGACLPG